MSDEVYVHVRVVAATKQPMEADVSGETAEALLLRAKGPCHFFVGDEDGERRSCRSYDVCLLMA